MKKLLSFSALLLLSASASADPIRYIQISTGGYANRSGTNWPVNLRDFGAKGDGSTDDTAAINAAIAYGGILYTSTGTFMTTGNHSITSQSLIGAGKANTTFKRASGTLPIFYLKGAGTISGVTLDGNSLGGSCLVSSSAIRGSIHDVNFKNVAASTYAFQLLGSFYMDIEDLEFNSNTFGNMFIYDSYYSSIHRTKMYGASSDWGLKLDFAVTDINFYDTYMESGINMTTIGVRDIRFIGLRVRLNTMNKTWFEGIYPTPSEVAQVSLQNVTILKTVDNTTDPLFDVSIYQLFLDNFHIYDSVSSTGWSVIRDRGTKDLRIQDWEIESVNPWNLFDPRSSGGYFTHADGINYTQGVIGTATWTSAQAIGDSGGAFKTSFVTVSNSNLNHITSNTFSSTGGYIFEHIYGNIDLSNAQSPVWVFNSSGTITDPNNAVVTYLEIYNKTLAQIQALTPQRTGQQYNCTDCTVTPVCISTGTSIGAFSSMGNKATACS